MSRYVLNQKGNKGPEAEARKAITVGMTLYGYCCGCFGRDSYGNKKILSIDGRTIIAEEERYGKLLIVQGHVHSWIDLLESSNYFLDNEMGECDE